jgi:hypothetical protein
MRKKAGRGSSAELPPVSMSATTSASPIEKLKVSFDQTGAELYDALGNGEVAHPTLA